MHRIHLDHPVIQGNMVLPQQSASNFTQIAMVYSPIHSV